MKKKQSLSVPSSHSRRGFLKLAAAAPIAASVAGLHVAGAAEDRPAEKPGKFKFHLGMASYTLRKFKLDEALAMTKRLALRYICFKSFHLPLDATPEQIADAVAKVKQAGLILYGGGVIGMGSQQQVDRAFDYAKAAGMTTIIGVPSPALLPAVEKKVKQYNIKVAIHNHGPGDKVYPVPQAAYEKIQGLDRRIGLCIDIGHTVRAGADLVKTVRQCGDRLLDVHLKDVTSATARGRACPAGRGVIDLPAFFKALVEIGYSGITALEYESEPNDPLPGAAESIGYCRGILATMG